MTQWLHRISLKFAWDSYRQKTIDAATFAEMVADALTPLKEKVEEADKFATAFQETKTREGVDELLEALYNWADFHRVWIDHLTL